MLLFPCYNPLLLKKNIRSKRQEGENHFLYSLSTPQLFYIGAILWSRNVHNLLARALFLLCSYLGLGYVFKRFVCMYVSAVNIDWEYLCRCIVHCYVWKVMCARFVAERFCWYCNWCEGFLSFSTEGGRCVYLCISEW